MRACSSWLARSRRGCSRRRRRRTPRPTVVLARGEEDDVRRAGAAPGLHLAAELRPAPRRAGPSRRRRGPARRRRASSSTRARTLLGLHGLEPRALRSCATSRSAYLEPASPCAMSSFTRPPCGTAAHRARRSLSGAILGAGGAAAAIEHRLAPSDRADAVSARPTGTRAAGRRRRRPAPTSPAPMRCRSRSRRAGSAARACRWSPGSRSEPSCHCSRQAAAAAAVSQ